jgi:hypothetical protein
MENKIELKRGKKYIFKETQWDAGFNDFYEAEVIDFAQYQKGMWDENGQPLYLLVKLQSVNKVFWWSLISSLNIIEDLTRDE